MALYAKDSRSLATISKLWSVPSKVLQITAARTSPPSPLPWSPVGPNSKNPPKNKIKKSVKLADHTCSCSYLTHFEYETHAIPETEIEVNLLKSGWKNSWNPIKRTYFWRVPAIWNHCVAWAGLSRYLVCKVTALEALTSALKPRESRREFEHQKSRQIAVYTPLWSERQNNVQKW